MATTKPLNFLITGGARGIGRGLSRLLLDNGHRVFVLNNNSEELNYLSKLWSPAYYKEVAFSECNVRHQAEIKSAVKLANEHFNGHLDVLINNAACAGGFSGTSIADITLEEWNLSIETNTGPMLMSQACLPMLRKSGDRHVGYAATKAGLIGLTHSMAVSLGPMVITVNALLPGWINVADECKKSDETGGNWENGLNKEDHQWHLSGRVGKVEDILRTVEYLVSARFVTGTEQVVDGGITRKMVYPE